MQYNTAVQRYMSQHGLVQRQGELSYLKAKAVDRTPEPFRKQLMERRPLQPVVVMCQGVTRG